jgi:hypothetical protein
VRVLVPERFPPLSQIVQSWSEQRIEKELSQSNWYAPFRDEILVRELSRRVSTIARLVHLVENARMSPDRQLLAARTRQILDVLADGQENKRRVEFEEAAIDALLAVGPDAEQAVLSVLGRDCSPALEARAIAMAKEGVFVSPAIAHIGRCSTSLQSYHLLEGLRLAPNNDIMRRFALDEFRRRNPQKEK